MHSFIRLKASPLKIDIVGLTPVERRKRKERVEKVPGGGRRK